MRGVSAAIQEFSDSVDGIRGELIVLGCIIEIRSKGLGWGFLGTGLGTGIARFPLFTLHLPSYRAMEFILRHFVLLICELRNLELQDSRKIRLKISQISTATTLKKYTDG